MRVMRHRRPLIQSFSRNREIHRNDTDRWESAESGEETAPMPAGSTGHRLLRRLPSVDRRARARAFPRFRSAPPPTRPPPILAACSHRSSKPQTRFFPESIGASPLAGIGTFQRQIATAIPTRPAPPNRNDPAEGLRQKTREWLETPVGSWSRKDALRGGFLVREWSGSGSPRERAIQQTAILRRWVSEYLAAAASKGSGDRGFVRGETKRPTGYHHGSTDSKEMVEILNRCLDSWRKASTAARHKGGAPEGTGPSPPLEAMELMDLFHDASRARGDTGLRPSQKTYSMCMNVLSLHPESPSACENLLELLERCRNDPAAGAADLRLYSACLHGLARCAKHHPGAPSLVERVFREMTGTDGLVPETACFVSLLHAWANAVSVPVPDPAGTGTRDCEEHEKTSPETSPAERAEAILDQMIRSYPHLVETICFNICIDAWGKHGHPERAESVLWKLHNYHRGYDKNETGKSQREVRPNAVSFNSAINAWAKSGKVIGEGSSFDPLEAASRAQHLLDQMKLHGYEPTPETYGAAMEAYTRVPNPGARVQGLLDELEALHLEGELSFPPPKVCYLMGVRAWGRTGPGGAERATLLVQKMSELSSGGERSRSDLRPCVVVYTALISAWAGSDAADAPDRTREVFCEMHRMARSGRREAAPNTVSLNGVLEAFCGHGRIDEARRFLDQWKRRVRPDPRSCTIILKAYARSKAPLAADHALEFVGQVETDYRHGEGPEPTVQMYSQVLVAFGNDWRGDGAFRAEELFWKMLRREDGIGVRPDATTLNCVLRAWSKSSEGGNAEKAESLLRRLRSEYPCAILPDPLSHLHLLRAWAHCRRRIAPFKAEAHLEEARRLCRDNPEWKLARAHFRGAIAAWEKSSDPEAPKRIRRLREEMEGI